MADTQKLQEFIRNKGLSISFLAEQLGLSREGFYLKLKRKSEFKASEIGRLKNILSLSDKDTSDIFFSEKVELNDNLEEEGEEETDARID